jgi:hypothetical protein
VLVRKLISLFHKRKALVAHFQNITPLLRGEGDGIRLDLLDDRIDLRADLLQRLRGDGGLMAVVHGIFLLCMKSIGKMKPANGNGICRACAIMP